MKKLVLLLLLAFAGVAAAQSSEPPRQRQREILRERPSGFWTSNRPAVGGAYRWRLLGIGVALAAGMGFVILRTIRRTPAPERRR